MAFAKAMRWGVQMAFMLDKQYYPYDKWIMAFLPRLPRLADPLLPIVNEAVNLSTPWDRKYELLNQLADVLDKAMVDDGIIKPHPKFTESPTSGYRLLEHAYAEIIQGLAVAMKAGVLGMMRRNLPSPPSSLKLTLPTIGLLTVPSRSST